MTPAEVKDLSLGEYLAMLRVWKETTKEQERQARAKRGRRK